MGVWVPGCVLASEEEWDLGGDAHFPEGIMVTLFQPGPRVDGERLCGCRGDGNGRDR